MDNMNKIMANKDIINGYIKYDIYDLFKGDKNMVSCDLYTNCE